ncbi:MAG: helix-turn-helix domain-containing protein [Phycisphaerales bacterium]|jgi:DNA-binding XRE family transcriptional regulator
MIRTDSEYQQALVRLEAERKRVEDHVAAWRAEGFTESEVTKLLQPLETFHAQYVEEVRSYERLKRGEFPEFDNLQGLGRVLIGLRIARGVTQRELAQRLDVSETMVSRDERNEYHGITVERARRILDALRVRLVTRVELGPGGSDSSPFMAA